MKFFHLADLHFGKILHGYDLLEEQKDFIQKIVKMAEEELPDAIVLAGDIYDRSVPSAMAMTLLEDFFLELNAISNNGKTIEILVIAGNHDSAQRLSYGSSFLERHHIHIAVLPPQEKEEQIKKVILEDAFGKVNFYLLPYTKTGMIRHLPEAENIQNSNEAIRYLLEREAFDWRQRNVLVSHQFYANEGKEPKQCDSEAPRLFVGGLDIVDTALVSRFDYVALGHIHTPQNLGKESIRYAGTPFCYSVSEAEQEKSVTVVEMEEKGEISYRYLTIEPLRKVCTIRGRLAELTKEDIKCHDYVSITLTDEEMQENAKEYLENYFDHILELQIDNTRTKKILEEEIIDIQETTPFEAFCTFFIDSTGRRMTPEEEERFLTILEEVKEEQE